MHEEERGKVPSLILVSTSDMRSPRRDELDRMVSSVDEFARANGGVVVRLFILLQRCRGDEAKDAAARFPAWVDVRSTDGRMSGSAARNLMLGPGAAGPCIGADDVVGFPDDDCWYPTGVLDRIFRSFSEDKELDFWFSRYSSSPDRPDRGQAVEPRLQDAIARGACNTIFLRGGLIKAIGYYDERLGIGAEIDGGEDTDYSIRAFYKARRSRFVNAFLIGHRDFDKKFRARYFTGSFTVIVRHAHRSGAGTWAAVRKLAIGGSLLLSRQIEPGTLWQALKLAFRGNVPRYPTY